MLTAPGGKGCLRFEAPGEMRQEKYDVEKMSYISLGEKTLTPGEGSGKYMLGLLWRCPSLIDYYIMIIIPGGGWWKKVEGNPRG